MASRDELLAWSRASVHTLNCYLQTSRGRPVTVAVEEIANWAACIGALRNYVAGTPRDTRQLADVASALQDVINELRSKGETHD